ncbi:hypothetical protein [Methylobacterium sp. OAE515]|uniref:hypothetical protein n=1 Tax=Methylobacterium sp. OAE515 TaxID=2817895 RepID=UPI0035A097A5
MMSIVISYVKNGKVLIYRVGVVAVDMMKLKTYIERFADTAHATILRQQAFPLRGCRIASHFQMLA